MSSSPVIGQGSGNSNKSCCLYRAPWVVPVSSPVLQDGAVVVDDNRIIAVGPYHELARRFPQLPLVSCRGVLLPALVNAHIHLELSILGSVHPDSPNSSMCDWISALLQKRLAANLSKEDIEVAAAKTVIDQYASGVGLMLDIGNQSLQRRDATPIEIISLLEMLAPSQKAQQAVIASFADLPNDISVTGHSPYSTGPDLLKFIKERCRQQETIFSFHLAENEDEALLLIHGEGCFVNFLKQRGAWDKTYPVQGIDSRGVVGYLEDLNLLDAETLCVHCVHLTDEEIRVVAGAGAHICLCPGSNRFLSVGTAPLGKILAAGVLPALGTDSIASNTVLDLWQEMCILRQEHPNVDSASILAMATLGGAMALHREADYGSLAPNRSASFLHIQGKEYEGVGDTRQLLDRLVSCGRPESISRVQAEL